MRRRPARAERGGTVSQDAALVGSIGVLTVATRGKAGPGEVRISIRGGSETFIAWSAEPLPVGATVLIIESHGTRSVHVSGWSDPVHGFPGN
jgi:hypothetical protein